MRQQGASRALIARLMSLVRRTHFYRSDGGDKQQDQDDEATDLRLPGHQILQAQNQGIARDQVRFIQMNRYFYRFIGIQQDFYPFRMM